MEDIKKNMGMTCSHCGCGCMHHKIIPSLVILFAALFLLGTYGVFSARLVSIAWPILVGAAGAVKLGGHKCKCC